MSIFYWQARDGQALWGDDLTDEFGYVNGNGSERKRDWTTTGRRRRAMLREYVARTYVRSWAERS